MEEQKNAIIVHEESKLSEIDISERRIQGLIHIIRGKQVMLDSDLAMLYQVETKRINESVKRNIKRFPVEFCFKLSEEEVLNLKSQFATSSLDNEKGHGGRRKLPYVFTEQGIAMLSALLRSDVAIQVSIQIMNTFVEMRRFFVNNSLMFERINEVELRQLEYQKESDEKFELIFDYISQHEEKTQKVFFEGQIYDAFSLFVDLISKAEKRIVLIDNYVDISTLNILSKKNIDVKAVIYTVKKTRLSEADIEEFNQQYPQLEVRYTDVFHDRFLIIDETMAYHIGASVKDAGKKCFGINKIEDEKIIQDILVRLE